ncbi:MAG: hypothetical protein LBS20_13260 [Prevotella sp.]|nr:hypothetical protein [Prevotella sp.]
MDTTLTFSSILLPENCDQRERFPPGRSRGKVGNVYISITLLPSLALGDSIQPDTQHVRGKPYDFAMFRSVSFTPDS